MPAAVLVVLAVGVALVYFTIAALIVPKISLGRADRRFTLLFRSGAVLFFVGCGLTHLHIAAHALGQAPELHELGFHVLQFVGGWTFVFAALRYLDISVEPKKRAQERRELEILKRLTMRDPLTGIYNRRYFDDALATEVARQHADGTPVSLVHLDIDDFKAVNDAGGHQLGDEVLCVVAATAERLIRPRDTAARIGGDEFVLLLPETGARQALLVAERLREQLGAVAVGEIDGISISAGVASCPEDARDARTLAAHADDALYRVKRAGKNGCAAAGATGAARRPAAAPDLLA